MSLSIAVEFCLQGFDCCTLVSLAILSKLCNYRYRVFRKMPLLYMVHECGLLSSEFTRDLSQYNENYNHKSLVIVVFIVFNLTWTLHRNVQFLLVI